MTTKDITAKLVAFAEGKINDPEIVTEIDGLLHGYVEGGLDEDTKLEIAAAIEASQALARLVERDQKAARLVNEGLIPELKRQADEIEPDTKLEAWLKDYAADPDNWGEDPDEAEVVVPFEKPAAPSQERSQPSWMMMAASIGGLLILAGGTLFYSFQRQQDLDRTVADLGATRAAQQDEIEDLQTETDRLQDQLTSLRETKRYADTALSQATMEVAQLETDLANATEDLKDIRNQRNGLERQVAALEGDMDRVAARTLAERNALESQVAELETEVDAVATARSEAEIALTTATEKVAGLESERAELEQQLASLDTEAAGSIEARNRLENQVAALETRLVTVNQAQADAETELREANRTIGDLITEGATLDRKVADLQAQRETLAADLSARDQQLNDTKATLVQTEQQIAELASERETLASTVTQHQQALAAAQRDLETTRQQSAGFQTAFEQLRLQTGWLRQVAGYHLGYAGSMREVEVTAEQQQRAQMLTKWLSNTLGSDFTIPDLSDAGMTFIGGRVFFVNGVPVGQIAYHDRQGRLTGFCFKRNPAGSEKSLSQSQYGNALQLIDWQDRDFQYVLIGFEDFETLEPIARQLEATYGDET